MHTIHEAAYRQLNKNKVFSFILLRCTDNHHGHIDDVQLNIGGDRTMLMSLGRSTGLRK